MIDRAIYFPYIRVPENEWFTRILLYWDKIGTITPSEYAEEPQRLGNYMADLISNNLLETIIPAKYIHEIPNWLGSFLDMIDNNQEITHRRGVALERGETTLIHIEKFSPIVEDLKDRGLAIEARDPWYNVERKTAELYMAYLSSALGSIEELQMTPITDKDDSLSAFEIAHPTAKAVSSMQFKMIEKLLPSPQIGIPVKEIIEFKNENYDLLKQFRRHIEHQINTLVLIDDEYIRNREFQLIQEELNNDIKEIEKKMKRKWRKILYGLVKSIGLGVPVGVAISSGNIPQILIALYNAWNGSQNIQTRLSEKPIAYAAFAKLKFR